MSMFCDILGRDGGGEVLSEWSVVLPFEGVDEREASSGCTLDREALAASKAANSSCAAVVILIKWVQNQFVAFVDIRMRNSVVLG